MAFVDQALTSIDTLCGVIKGKSVTPSLPRNANSVKNKVTAETARVSHYVLCHITSHHITIRYFLCEYSSRFVPWT
jgi:hypothetical protein